MMDLETWRQEGLKKIRADPKEYLREIIRSGDHATPVRELIRDNPGLLEARYSGNLTPLLWAIYFGRNQIVDALVESGAKIDFIAAIAVRRTDLVWAMLKENPALIRKRSPDSWTALHIAARYGTAEIVALLIEAGADVEKPGIRGVTPLFFGLDEPYEIAELLLARGAQVNAVQKHGFTPLHWAAASGILPAVRFLIAHGADANRQTNAKQTAWSLSVRNGHRDVTAFLTSCRS